MRRDKVKRVSLILLAIIFLYSSPAYANAALPLVFLSLPGMALALVPVIAMESYVLMKILGLSMGSGLSVVFVANVVSTIVGLPVTWLLLLPLAKLPQHEIPGVLWFMPLYGVKKYPKDWMVPAACLLLLIPYFFVSWFIEYKIAMRMLDGFEPQNLSYGVLVSNLVSYGILALIVLGWLIWVCLSKSSMEIVDRQDHETEVGVGLSDLGRDLDRVLMGTGESSEMVIAEDVEKIDKIEAPTYVPRKDTVPVWQIMSFIYGLSLLLQLIRYLTGGGG